MRSRKDDHKLCFAHMCTKRLIDVDLLKASGTYVNATFWDVKLTRHSSDKLGTMKQIA